MVAREWCGGDRRRWRRHSHCLLAGKDAIRNRSGHRKDDCSELLARELEVDLFIMATDAEAVFVDWRKPAARAILLPPIVSPALNFMEA